ncbi:protein quiver-like [Bacillus rossius redtenbacheri]|uniref:protein quiver-like n=1 Tax=Bacillus rossius redtenbacheri TaxID=93214 RepID=UPI002FDD844E
MRGALLRAGPGACGSAGRQSRRAVPCCGLAGLPGATAIDTPDDASSAGSSDAMLAALKSPSRSRPRRPGSMVRWPLHIPVIMLVLVSGSEESCQESVLCYVCNSWSDARCSDPFNTSSAAEDQPPVQLCRGCCVKVVSNAKSQHEGVIRTCTSEFPRMQCLSLLDYTCSATTETRRKGNLCFCEEDLCNSADVTLPPLHCLAAAAAAAAASLTVRRVLRV